MILIMVDILYEKGYINQLTYKKIRSKEAGKNVA